MENLKLKYFKDAAQTENFTQTARKYGVPTSAVSQSIHRLEEEMGTRLFDRSSNRVILNEEGRILYDAICRVEDLLENTRRQLSDRNGQLTGEICLQIACNRRIVSEAIRQFSGDNPKVRFVLRHGTDTRERFDLIISDDAQLKHQYAREELLTEKLAVAFPESHPLARQETVRVKDLENERFITMQAGSRLYCLTQQLCSQAGFSPKISIQCDDPYYVRKYIQMGLGIGFVPMTSWQGQLPEGVICRQLEGIIRTTCAYWNPADYMPRAVRQFLALLKALSAGTRGG